MSVRDGYIGRAPGDASVIVARQNYVLTGVQTSFTFASGYVSGYMDAYVNGVRQVVGQDYTASDGSTVTLSNPAGDGDVVELVAYKAFNATTINSTPGDFRVGGKLTVVGVSSLNAVNVAAAATIDGKLTVIGITSVGDVVSSGIVTADAFYGDGSGLTGLANTDRIFADTITVGTALTVTGPVSISGTITYDDVTNVDSVGVVTARSGIRVGAGQSISPVSGSITYYGDGSQLTGISVGLTTEAATPSSAVVTLDLTAAQDHKVTATGICTITCSGGTEAESHTIRVINSGIATVGFSTYFLFPSGSVPTLPTADGSISLISFTVNRTGGGPAVAATELLSGASLNYS